MRVGMSARSLALLFGLALIAGLARASPVAAAGGAAWSWGRNEHGELAGPSNEKCYIYTCSTQPVAIGGLPQVRKD